MVVGLGATQGRAAGLSDTVDQKAAVACQVALAKGAAKVLKARLRGLAKCTGAVFKCVQQKPEEAKCLTKARLLCAKQLGTNASIRLKENAAFETIGRTCSRAAAGVLESADGLGYLPTSFAGRPTGIGAECLTLIDRPSFAPDTLAECVVQRFAGSAERLFFVAQPRARDLLVTAGVPLTPDPVPDLPRILECGDASATKACAAVLPAFSSKALLKCTQKITNATAAYASGILSAVTRCTSKTFDCLQRKPGDGSCIAGSGKKCRSAFAKIATAARKLEATLDAQCGPVDVSVLRHPRGAGLSGLECECEAVLVPAVATLDDYGACIQRQSGCRLAELVDYIAPRADELLQASGVDLGSLCPLPRQDPPAAATAATARFGATTPPQIKRYVTSVRQNLGNSSQDGIYTVGGAPVGRPGLRGVERSAILGRRFVTPGGSNTYVVDYTVGGAATAARAPAALLPAPRMIIALRRLARSLAEDFYTLDLPTTPGRNSIVIQVEYAENLKPCTFALAFAVQNVDGTTSEYADLPQIPAGCAAGTPNGTPEDGEECDDGNGAPGDGCENDCTLTVPSSIATPTTTASRTPTPSAGATKSPTPSPTATTNASSTSTPTATLTATPTPTSTVTLTRTPTPTTTATKTPTPTRTPTPTTTATPNPCANITTIPPNVAPGVTTFFGTTSGGSGLNGTGACNLGTGPEKVFSWTPAASGTAIFKTCPPATNFLTEIYVRTSACSNGSQIACDRDDPCMLPPQFCDGCHVVDVAVNAGTQYFIVVDGVNGAAGSFALELDYTPAVN